jgi:hypothetical protein
MGTDIYGIDFGNMLKWVFGCTVGLVVENFVFLSKIIDIIPFFINIIINNLTK